MIEKKDKGEIAQEYKLAKDRIEQIQTLSELYAVPTATIRGVLSERGVYEITPEVIEKAADAICNKGLTFGALRNNYKAFMGHDAKAAKKVFKDYVFSPWAGAETPESPAAAVVELQRIREKAAAALAAADERIKNRGNRNEKQDLAPAPAVVAKPFTDEQAGLLVAGLLSLLAEQEARAQQWQGEVDELQQRAAALLNAADAKIQQLNELRAEIAKGRALLEQLREQTSEKSEH